MKVSSRAQRDYRREAKVAKQHSADNPRKITDVDHLIEWCEATLKVPAGMRQGEPFEFLPYQKDFLRGALGDPAVRKAGQSLPRKQGKSGEIAAVLDWALLNVQGFQALVVSLDADRSMLLRQEMESLAHASGITAIKFRGGTTSSGNARVWEMDSHVEFLPANVKGKTQGWKINFGIIDEAGLLSEKYRDLWEGVDDSLATNREGKLICVSVRAQGEMFNEIAARADDDDVFWQEFAAEEGCDIYDEAVWERANPALDVLKSREHMRTRARDARLNRDKMRHFMVYHLNIPIDPEIDVIMEFNEWLEHTHVVELPERRGPAIVGWDLGGSRSMTAAAVYWPRTKRLETVGQFPHDMTLQDRGRKDNVGGLYQRAQSEGELFVAGIGNTDLDKFVERIHHIVKDAEWVTVYCDRWRVDDAQKVAYQNDFEWEIPLDGRGQGFKDGSHDIRAFRSMVFAGNVKCIRSLLLESAIAESKIMRDPAGNEKITRARESGRIDMLQAVVLAVAGGQVELDFDKLYGRGTLFG